MGDDGHGVKSHLRRRNDGAKFRASVEGLAGKGPFRQPVGTESDLTRPWTRTDARQRTEKSLYAYLSGCRYYEIALHG